MAQCPKCLRRWRPRQGGALSLTNKGCRLDKTDKPASGFPTVSAQSAAVLHTSSSPFVVLLSSDVCSLCCRIAGCAIGCEECDGSSRGPIPSSTDPEWHRKFNICNNTDTKATICDPALRTVNRGAECGADDDWYYYSPWRGAVARTMLSIDGGRIVSSAFFYFFSVTVWDFLVRDIFQQLPDLLLSLTAAAWLAGTIPRTAALGASTSTPRTPSLGIVARRCCRKCRQV